MVHPLWKTVWWFLQKLKIELSFSSVQSLRHVQLFATPWTAAHQASLSITNCWNLPKLMPIDWVMPSKHLILCRPPLLLPSIFPSIRVFSNESVVCTRWPKYWRFSFSFSISHLQTAIYRLSQITFRYNSYQPFVQKYTQFYYSSFFNHYSVVSIFSNSSFFNGYIQYSVKYTINYVTIRDIVKHGIE